ncbi:hypothetical protein L917_12796 [Phytophthora nicotianae]|uniref:Uncharacterized protein n=1 Tax=Phytophthora nicotianae TaxID=4792 RepID=W2KUT6_PHYNI|nr:hypothetical protein L917_12796 [Phytophthora nicotianae]
MANLDRSKRSRLGLTKAEYRTNYMMRTAKLSMSTKVTPDLCDSMAAHTQISRACFGLTRHAG